VPGKTCGYKASKGLIVQGIMEKERAGLRENHQLNPPYLTYLSYMMDHVEVNILHVFPLLMLPGDYI
jgi:hypothetical protein